MSDGYPDLSRGDKITVIWPDGPYDFELEFESYPPMPFAPHEPGWQYVQGIAGYTKLLDMRVPEWRTFYVRRIGDREFTLVSKPTR